ncbi:hypothetical protein [Undibacterium pigrum]|uniref:Uncharacterized protein n=1 Tax=Undibacterium pigrum TaxID=401470 RepID=A0A318IKN2_9BURK|nr:hypothetical protein [Undibacterium pigrum]PXX33716.1 hypothetical protein DFR42_12912 [Undibacterium pigrum]
MQSKVIRMAIILLSCAPCISAYARDDHALPELLRVMGFSELIRAQVDVSCRQDAQYAANPRLITLCDKRHHIPDTVIEGAALPYLRRHMSTQLAQEAIAILTSPSEKAVSRKLTAEIASGNHNLLTPDELLLLKRRNESRHGQALSAFSSDPEQGRAVARAMFEYDPRTGSSHPAPLKP